jgi:glycosyltransferase involved in cell wall biosynthesis
LRLVIFSSVSHFQQAQIVAHAGFVKEVESWAKIYDKVLIISLSDNGTPAKDAIAYTPKNISYFWLDHVVKTGGINGKLLLIFKYPQWISKALKVLRREDVLMARGPDSLGFLGFVLGKVKNLPHFGKYADQWQPFKGEPIGYRLQKMIYRSQFFGGPVQIYGESDPARPHLVPFFTSSVSMADWLTAGNMIVKRRFELPFKLLFVGRLVKAKGVDLILDAVKNLQQNGYDVCLDIVGDGPEHTILEEYSSRLGISQWVTFYGRLGWQEIQQKYANSHCFVQASRKEGFGKVFIEAMTFALPIIGTDVGISKAILSPPRFGMVIPPDDSGSISSQVQRIMDDYQYFTDIGKNARQEAKKYLLENVEKEYREFTRKFLEIYT